MEFDKTTRFMISFLLDYGNTIRKIVNQANGSDHNGSNYFADGCNGVYDAG